MLHKFRTFVTGERLKKSGEDLAQVVSAAAPEQATEEEEDD